jgi:ABC-type Fe3+ transport system permease subunit
LTVRLLGVTEARRMLWHPANAVALAATVLAVATIIFSDESSQQQPATIAQAALLLLGTMFYPLATVVAANRVAGATSRRSVREAMTVTPTQERRRTMALCLGVLTGPVVVGVGIMLLAFVVGPFVPESDGLAARTLLELLQIPSRSSAAVCWASRWPGGSRSPGCSPWSCSACGSATSRSRRRSARTARPCTARPGSA